MRRAVERGDGSLLALFESPYWLERLVADHPDWCLDAILTGEHPADGSPVNATETGSP